MLETLPFEGWVFGDIADARGGSGMVSIVQVDSLLTEVDRAVPFSLS